MSRPADASVPKPGSAPRARPPHRFVCVLACLCYALIATTGLHPVLAQAPDQKTQDARALFNEGLEFADQNRWVDAADRFRLALALRPSPVIAYNLGTALRELHRWVEACDMFTSASADQAASPALHRAAAHALDELKPRLGRLQVHVDGLHDGDQISLDERALDAGALEKAITVDPGSHQLRISRGEQILHREPVLVFEGALRAVSVRLTPTPTDTARLAPSGQKPQPMGIALPPPPRKATENSDTPVWVWAGASTLAISAITITAILLANASSSKSPAPGDFDPPVVHLRPKMP